MRHIILGADTPIGSSIIRILGTLGVKNIIACSRDRYLPEGVNRRQVKPVSADIIDIYSLVDLIEEGDIVYNTQVITDETIELEEANLTNVEGLINLLGIATQAKAGRIVTYIPQQIGWKVPDNASERTKQMKPSPLHHSFRNAIEVIDNYWSDDFYGWKAKNIREFVEQAEKSTNGDDTEDKIEESKGNNTTSPSEPNSQSGPSLSVSSDTSKDISSSKNSGPSIKKGPSMPKTNDNVSSGPTLGKGPKMPNLGENDPMESSNTAQADEGEEEEEQYKSSEKDSSSEENGDQDINAEDQDIDEEMRFERVPLLLCRMGRLFGPFVEDPSVRFCRQVRLQRIIIHGNYKEPISWINPLDAARAMIIMADNNIVEIDSEQYLVNGFTATTKDLIHALDDVNHSTTKISKKGLFLEKIKHNVKSLLKKVGFNFKDPYYDYLKYNTRQKFDDSKARDEWGWEERYNLEKTAEDTMDWYLKNVL